MGTFVWLYSPRTNSSHFIMNSFVVFATLLASACAAPQTLVNTVNKGPQTGPLTALVGGDLVQTPKGLRSLALEGFSEDLDQDGFVDPIGQAVVAAPVAYTVPHVVSHPVAAVNTAVAPVAYHNVYAAAPVAVKAAETVEVKSVPAVAPVTYTLPQVYTHAVSSVGVPASTELLTKTVVAAPAVQYVANYAPLTHFVSGIPVAAAPAAAAAAAPVAEEAAGVEVA